MTPKRLHPLSERDTRRLSAAFAQAGPCGTCGGRGYVTLDCPLYIRQYGKDKLYCIRSMKLPCLDCTVQRVEAELTRWQRLRNALLWAFVALLAAAVVATAYFYPQLKS